MDKKQLNIFFAGAGSIGTAIGNALAKAGHGVSLYTIEEHVAKDINERHINSDYFPTALLNDKLVATTNIQDLKDADILFLAIPSIITVDFILQNKDIINKDTMLVNLAKGFGCGKMTITACLGKMLDNPICTMKGPTFAREIINGQPTALTFAASDVKLFHQTKEIFEDTSIFLDFTTDVEGVEYLSILKNIYAITVGIVDAHFDSPNLRFLILTKAFDEMRRIMLRMGGNEESMFHYCGYGDFSLTALNDLSRNRTLGLLIGKGFFTPDISDKIVLEGKIAVNTICTEILSESDSKEFPLIFELHKIFVNNYDISAFVSNILKLAR
ncbi:MAG: NAD(P)H-dependent glycerol-3-phosphate dehydrogenase [Bacteroidota bacterium]